METGINQNNNYISIDSSMKDKFIIKLPSITDDKNNKNNLFI